MCDCEVLKFISRLFRQLVVLIDRTALEADCRRVYPTNRSCRLLDHHWTQVLSCCIAAEHETRLLVCSIFRLTVFSPQLQMTFLDSGSSATLFSSWLYRHERSMLCRLASSLPKYLWTNSTVITGRAGVISSAVLAVSACSYAARCLQIDGLDSLFTGLLLDNTLDNRSITRHLPLSQSVEHWHSDRDFVPSWLNSSRGWFQMLK